MVSLAGCSALTGGGQSDGGETTVPTEQAVVEDDDANATAVGQTLRITANETTADSELTAVGATYPREHFTVHAAGHENVSVGVDTNGDGELDERFNETHVSGVNNNAYSFDVTLDTDYTLAAGDTVVVDYPAVDNPADPGEYEVQIRLNDEQNATGTVAIE